MQRILTFQPRRLQPQIGNRVKTAADLLRALFHVKLNKNIFRSQHPRSYVWLPLISKCSEPQSIHVLLHSNSICSIQFPLQEDFSKSCHHTSIHEAASHLPSSQPHYSRAFSSWHYHTSFHVRHHESLSQMKMGRGGGGGNAFLKPRQETRRLNL